MVTESAGAIFNMSDPCHTSLLPAASISGASLTSASKLNAQAAKEQHISCPIGQLDASLN